MFRNLLLVGAGGAMGSIARYVISFFISKFVEGPIHFAATFGINVIGSLLIGILFGLMGRHQLSAGGWLILASGFCGGFTTFSTFALENVDLMQKGQSFTALIYMGLSVVVGLVLCRAGIWLTS